MSKGMNKNTSIKTVKLIRNIGSEMDWNDKKNKQLVEAILALKNVNEAECFLRDLMTEGEIQEFANRLEAASLLSRDVQYNAIIENTGLSSTTIARISKWLNGSLGGYRLILSRLSNHHHNSSKFGKGLSLS
ncbi:MAG: TrpR-related protein YerC/YecD [Candidatus Nomurabacteria bacterium GW2011_GWA2_43_15]|uniref:TrpR-related protein YerC/YecD n=2 Tax=Candidatus Nomuraibacteriota TaxID=1752729 RepID=A0A0G1GNQ8_9BACT|nr:MAG: TrpR-related protein YerC/YecD [Candidatus Nomurabacteria bacterium GW2011_GWA2_43_15]KKT19076.1 MAG: TrpR-related protein YerC/YecD [Candidatus Nomurabacteria bacterium GW2011_GWB1_43_7]